MKKFTILSIVAILFAVNVNAKVWRVNSLPNVDADFALLQPAIDSAAWGDTLYIGASPISYGSGTFDKKLCVIGAGYWHEENDSTMVYEESSWVKQLVFNPGSEGSEISGLYVYYGSFGSTQNWKLIEINTDSISILRNYVYGLSGGQYTYVGYTIYLNGNRSKISIQQNWIATDINDYHSAAGNGTVHGIYFSGIPQNCIISNNFIHSYKSNTFGTAYSVRMTSSAPQEKTFITNNVMWGHLASYYTVHFNNILIEGSYGNNTGNETYNNLCYGTQFPVEGSNNLNNQQNIAMDSVFMDHDKYIDNGYFLEENSPAKGAGLYGGDCGAFGNDAGGDPYVLSGMPAVPYVFGAVTKPMGVSTIPVNIKAKSHN